MFRTPLTDRQKSGIRLLAVAGGILLGHVCPLLPVEKQIFCHLAAEIISFFTGGK